MKNTSARPADGIEAVMNTYGNMLFRLCLLTLGNAADAEDAVQDTLIKYLQKAPVFESADHEKAWLITVATNRCRDMLRENCKGFSRMSTEMQLWKETLRKREMWWMVKL